MSVSSVNAEKIIGFCKCKLLLSAHLFDRKRLVVHVIENWSTEAKGQEVQGLFSKTGTINERLN